ncbi:type VI secretion protein IcmF/TssM N-terminal domain-containing protein [Dyella humicola]|uniref:type VI secretion protein IcmF/TssM N-terminal domain-containing protein n=1 Tax=Dyella humicola TaxID=2992126 RepID=UPI00224CE7DB|nr:type VI secretion protein IcmF/TssM N-terminal domain-containing protein [Dyella humicola]
MRLLDYFSPLFAYGLVVDEQAAAQTAPSELAPLNARARELIDQARKLALANGKSMQEVELAGFAVVAWFDEIIVRHEAKRDQPSPLQLTLFHTSDASSEFFEHLARLDSRAEEVREVYCTALLLGFVGQYYYEKGDGGELGRIKSVYCRPYAATAAVLQALQRESITPQPYLTPDSPARRKPGPWAGRRPALFVALGVVLLVLVAFVAPVFSSAMSAQAWYLAGILVVIAGMLGWAGSLAWHWLAFTRASADPHARWDIRSVRTALKDAVRRVRGAILHPLRRRGKWRQLSRHPWLVFLGDNGANVRGLLQAAAQSSHGRLLPGDGVSTSGHWWLFRSLVAIEMDPRLAQAREDTQAADLLWSEALTRLSRERRKLPLDGVVLGVAAQSLLGPGADIKATAARLRRMANEATQRLHLQLPLYVVVTGMDVLPGHASFKAALPPAVFRKVLGWRRSEASSAGESSGRMDGHFDDTFERMRMIGLAALAKQREPHGRREIFEFRQSLSDLQYGLHAFIDQLMAEDPAGQHALRWCGLYFTGVSRGDSTGGEFVEDLFNRFLPGDRLLARRTA